MILWIVLFVLVILISFVLAAKSMRDFSDIPTQDEEYSLFLIRNIASLNKHLLDSIQSYLMKKSAYISFERLFKGGRSALVVFGPRKLILQHKQDLDVLELEDYTNVDIAQVSAWEVGVKGSGQLFKNLPALLETEQLWWQVIFSEDLKPQITVIVVASDSERRHALTEALHNLAPDLIHKLPKAFSNSQLLDFYKKRSFRRDNKNPKYTAGKISQLFLTGS